MEAFSQLQNKCVLEKKIFNIVHKDNKSFCHFNYEKISSTHYKLVILTSNEKHNELFIFYVSEQKPTQLECLQDAYKFISEIQNKKNEYLTYEVEWSKKGGNRIISHFYGKDFLEIIDKFFSNKEINEYVIWRISLMPIS